MLADGDNASVVRFQQVVIVAAGYDTRAYRLAQPGVTFYEVDLPSASEKKKKLVHKLKLVTSAVSGCQ
jgi:O-methyltransferase involved in polyketide biosynthesis